MSNFTQKAIIFKAFCDPNRLQILDLLRTGEKCSCVLLESLGISQSTLSYHMGILVKAGVVIGRVDGKWTHYSINLTGIVTAQNALTPFLETQSTENQPDTCCL